MTDDLDLLGEPRGPGSTPIPNDRESDMDDSAFDASPDVLNATAQGRLRTFIERLERLDADKAAVMQDMNEVFAEAKGEGYSVQTLRAVIKRRKKDKSKVQEEEALLDLYLSALGEI